MSHNLTIYVQAKGLIDRSGYLKEVRRTEEGTIHFIEQISICWCSDNFVELWHWSNIVMRVLRTNTTLNVLQSMRCQDSADEVFLVVSCACCFIVWVIPVKRTTELVQVIEDLQVLNSLCVSVKSYWSHFHYSSLLALGYEPCEVTHALQSCHEWFCWK